MQVFKSISIYVFYFVCVCAYTSVLGQMNGLMDTAYATTFTCTFSSLLLLFYMYILSR